MCVELDPYVRIVGCDRSLHLVSDTRFLQTSSNARVKSLCKACQLAKLANVRAQSYVTSLISAFGETQNISHQNAKHRGEFVCVLFRTESKQAVLQIVLSA